MTVVEAGPCVVTQVRTQETDGYDAIQLGYVDPTEKRINQPQAGHFKKVGTAPKRFLREDLGVKAPICDTQANYGGLQGVYREATHSDFIDMHAYWQHPRFPGRPWDRNTQMWASPSRAWR